MTAMDISRTDLTRAIKYMEDAARVYDGIKGQRNVCRAWVLRQMVQKFKRKLSK